MLAQPGTKGCQWYSLLIMASENEIPFGIWRASFWESEHAPKLAPKLMNPLHPTLSNTSTKHVPYHVQKTQPLASYVTLITDFPKLSQTALKSINQASSARKKHNIRGKQLTHTFELPPHTNHLEVLARNPKHIQLLDRHVHWSILSGLDWDWDWEFLIFRSRLGLRLTFLRTLDRFKGCKSVPYDKRSIVLKIHFHWTSGSWDIGSIKRGKTWSPIPPGIESQSQSVKWTRLLIRTVTDNKSCM